MLNEPKVTGPEGGAVAAGAPAGGCQQAKPWGRRRMVSQPAGAADGSYKASFAGAPHVTFVRVDNARHFVMYDQPAAFDAALDGFLGK